MAMVVTHLLARMLAACLEMDHIGTRVEGDKTIYTFKTTSFRPTFTEIKAKIFSVLDLPVDIPEDVTIREVKRGPVLREYLVDITVDSGKIGKVENLLAKKYGIIRRRPYR